MGEFMTNQTQLSLLDREWISTYAPVVLATMRGQWTTDDLHAILPEPEQKNWLGALIATLRNQGLIEKVGYRPSKRPEANGRAICVWRVKSTPAESKPVESPSRPGVAGAQLQGCELDAASQQPFPCPADPYDSGVYIAHNEDDWRVER